MNLSGSLITQDSHRCFADSSEVRQFKPFIIARMLGVVDVEVEAGHDAGLLTGESALSLSVTGACFVRPMML